MVGAAAPAVAAPAIAAQNKQQAKAKPSDMKTVAIYTEWLAQVVTGLESVRIFILMLPSPCRIGNYSVVFHKFETIAVFKDARLNTIYG